MYVDLPEMSFIETRLGHFGKLASDYFLEDKRSHLSHRGIRSRVVEVNLKPTEASKAG